VEAKEQRMKRAKPRTARNAQHKRGSRRAQRRCAQARQAACRVQQARRSVQAAPSPAIVTPPRYAMSVAEARHSAATDSHQAAATPMPRHQAAGGKGSAGKAYSGAGEERKANTGREVKRQARKRRFTLPVPQRPHAANDYVELLTTEDTARQARSVWYAATKKVERHAAGITAATAPGKNVESAARVRTSAAESNAELPPVAIIHVNALSFDRVSSSSSLLLFLLFSSLHRSSSARITPASASRRAARRVRAGAAVHRRARHG